MTQNAIVDYDLVILGSGEAGKYLAWTLGKAGQRVAVVERKYIGGACPNIACLPSKNVIHSAKVASLIRRSGEFGISVGEVAIDAKGVRERKRQMVADLVAVHVKNYREAGVDLLMGNGKFIAPRTLEVSLNDGSTQTVRGRNVVIGSGTRATVDDIPGLRAVEPWTHIEALELDRIPEHLIVLGGGYIGLEMAQAALRFGSRVTIIDRNKRLLPREDDDVAQAITTLLTDEGATVLTNAHAVEVSGKNGSEVMVVVDVNGQQSTLEGSHLLVAAGRTPNTEDMGLDVAGVELKPNGYIRVDDHLRTTTPDTWAVGDVAGSPHFTHISYDDFRVVRDNLSGKDHVTTGRQVPYTMFTDPELARIGLNETEAQAKDIPYRLFKVPMAAVLRTRTLSEMRGFMKALVDPQSNMILGFTIFGVDGGEVMGTVQMAMLGRLTYENVREAVITHPTLTEGLVVLFSAESH